MKMCPKVTRDELGGETWERWVFLSRVEKLTCQLLEWLHGSPNLILDCKHDPWLGNDGCAELPPSITRLVKLSEIYSRRFIPGAIKGPAFSRRGNFLEIVRRFYDACEWPHQSSNFLSREWNGIVGLFWETWFNWEWKCSTAENSMWKFSRYFPMWELHFDVWISVYFWGMKRSTFLRCEYVWNVEIFTLWECGLFSECENCTLLLACNMLN